MCSYPLDCAAVFTDGYGEIHYDISYGGSFYIYANITQFGLSFKSPITDIVATCVKLRTAVTAEITISHPGVSDDLAFLYGVIMYTGPLDNSDCVEEICMFADGQVSAVTIHQTHSGVSCTIRSTALV